MRKILLIGSLLCCLSLRAAVFQKSYYDTPLYIVLQDLESHFGCSFMCRHQDIVNAPNVGGTYHGSDMQVLLRKFLGNRLTFVVRNNIVIITPVPEQPTAVSGQHSAISNQQAVHSVPIETIQEDTVQEERIHWPIELRQTNEMLDVTPLDSLFYNRKLDIQSKHIAMIDEKAVANGISHALLASVGLGYGTELQTFTDLRYVFFFYRHWGVSAGLWYAHAAQYKSGIWLQEGRIGIPIGVHTRWLFTPQWGLHFGTSVAVSFPVYNNGTAISAKSVDETILIHLDSAHPISKHTTLLTGVFGNFSGTDLTQWSVGLHLGFQIGK